MKLYKYGLKTGEFTGEMESQKRPNGQDIIDVIGATVKQPPQTGEKQAARWTGESWELVEDHHYTRACLQTSYRSRMSEAARQTKAAKTSAGLS